ncbi:MAG: flavodoxin family protein [Clostridium sp.]|nr:flavodoxin family protein [Erysipelotrichaceae bacterium]MCR0519856.1 flavodoxin family protein [[Clostridium] innocuum]MCR0524443.1 flavodoxin family protein [[Clostridium] innocuum]MCR0622477.1 flavodoxin family protein [[Clostridium] innocuum]
MMELVLNDTMYRYQPKHSQTLVDIRTMKLRGCLGCGACTEKKEYAGRCALQDDMQTLYPMIAKCERLVFICKLRYGCCSTKCKCILDRMAVLGQQEYIIRNKELMKRGWKTPLQEIAFFIPGEPSPKEKQVFQEWLQEVHGIIAGTRMSVTYLSKETAL